MSCGCGPPVVARLLLRELNVIPLAGAKLPRLTSDISCAVNGTLNARLDRREGPRHDSSC